MGESIKRNLTPTVGQNSLQKWLASPELASPVVRQSTELRVTQDLFLFQQTFRYWEDAQQLGGVETETVFSVVVPNDECWLMDWFWVEHDSAAGSRIWEIRQLHTNILSRQAIIARRPINPGQPAPLIGAQALTPAADTDSSVYPTEPVILLPLDAIEIHNVEGMIAGEVGRISTRYKKIPVPLEVSDQGAATIWQSTTN